MTEPVIEIHSLVYSYFKRYWWQLSSIANQVPCEGTPVPHIRCVASVSPDDPFKDWQDKTKAAFTGKIDYKQHDWTDSETFARRGWVRDYFLQNSTAEWIIYNDADVAYDPQFFAHLSKFLQGWAGDPRPVGTWRNTMGFKEGYEIIDTEDYIAPVVDPTGKLAGICNKKSKGGKICAAGFFQLIHVPSVRKLGVTYTDGAYDNDIFKARYNTPSDIVFRKKVGGFRAFQQCKPSYHINHYRKGDECHIDWTKPFLH